MKDNSTTSPVEAIVLAALALVTVTFIGLLLNIGFSPVLTA